MLQKCLSKVSRILLSLIANLNIFSSDNPSRFCSLCFLIITCFLVWRVQEIWPCVSRQKKPQHMVVRVYLIEWGLMRMRWVGQAQLFKCWERQQLRSFSPNLGKPVRFNASHCFGMSSSKRLLDIRYRHKGNRQRAGFENPSSLYKVQQAEH